MSAIRVELELKDGAFVSGMLRAGQSVKQFETELARVDPHFRKMSASGGNYIKTINRVEDANKSLLGTMRDISIVGGFAILAFQSLSGASGGLVGGIIRVNAEMQKLQFQMQSMSTAKDPIQDAANAVVYLRDMATRAPFSLGELTSTFVKLKATGVDPMNKSMQALVDGIAAFGGSDEQLHRVTLGISQMTGKGVIQMEEMRQQLGESMPTAMRLMARSMGISVGELTKAISTGTVESSSALNKFYDELNRAYGGSAQRMMGTFSGQLTLMTANLQKLATSGGLKSFFNSIEAELQGINQFLTSSDAKNFADGFGNALSMVMRYASQTVKVIYSLRSELKVLAIALAIGGVARLAVGAFTALAAAVSMAGVQMKALQSSLALSSVYLTQGASGVGVMGSSLLGLRFMAQGAGVALMGIGRAFFAYLPAVALFAGAIYLLADNFGLLGSKTKEAYEELRDYGAESVSQAQAIIEARKKELEYEISIQKVLNGRPGGAYSNAGAEAQAALDQLNKDSEQILLKAGEAEARIAVENQERILSAKADGLNAAYELSQSNTTQMYEDELKAAEAAGESVETVRKRYQERLLKASVDLTTAKIKIHDDELARIQEAAAAADGEERGRIEKMAAFVIGRRNLLYAERDSLSMDNFGVDFTSAPEDDSKNSDRGAKVLEDLQDAVKGLEADLDGASGAYAKMQAQIRRGDYGSVEEGGEEVQKLHDALLEATLQKEALDKVMSGDKKASTDLLKIQADLVEREMELKIAETGEKMSDADRFMLRMNEGYYEGLGPIENIREAIMGVAGATSSQGEISQEVARVMSEQTFGPRMIVQIDEIGAAIRRLNDETRQLGGTMNGIKFDSFGMPMGGSGFAGGGPGFSNVDGGILDMIASVESRSQDNNGYNTTLDNGRWTGGNQDLVSMTLKEIRALQASMLTAENQAVHGDGGSSALGRYQIVGRTLQGLMEDLGLTGDELFDKDMQDRLASVLIKQSGGSVSGIRGTWEGMSANAFSDADILAAMQRSVTGPTQVRADMGDTGAQTPAGPAVAPPTASAPYNPSAYDKALEEQRVQRTADLVEQARIADQKSSELDDRENANSRSTYLTDLATKKTDAEASIGELGKNYEQLLDAIRGGELGKSTSEGAPEYAALITAAKELDAVEEKMAARRTAIKDADKDREGIEKERLELQRQIAEAMKSAEDPNYKGQNDDLVRLNDEMDEYLKKIEAAYGATSPEYAEAQAYKTDMMANGLRLQGETARAGMAQQRQDLEDSLMSETELRKTETERQLAEVDKLAVEMRAAGMSEVQIVEETERLKSLIRQKYNEDTVNPIAVQMKEWGDIQTNLQNASATWMDSAATGIAGLITGTGDLKSAVDSMLSDVVNMGVRYMLSGMSGKGQSAGKGAGIAVGGKGGPAANGGKGMMGKAMSLLSAGVAHTGGIAGGHLMTRNVSPGTFAGARKYHKGGVVGGMGMSKLLPSEVPIIAKKGEGVFTPEQMKHLGGTQQSQNISINAPVSVNASGGSPEQNSDLAARIGREIEGNMRGVVVQEFQRQMRQGNMLNKRG